VILGSIIVLRIRGLATSSFDGVFEATRSHQNVLIFGIVVTLANHFHPTKLITGWHLSFAFPLNITSIEASVVTLSSGDLGLVTVSTNT